MSQATSTFALIGERYLDTQHDADYIRQVEAELAARGVVGATRVVYEYLAAAALWWNILWWEWVRLDKRDVWVGWLLNVALFVTVGLAVGYFMGGTAAGLAVVLLHALTLMLGFGLRSGSVNPQTPGGDSAT